MIEVIVAARCTGCDDCVAACPTHVFDPAPGGGPPIIARPDQCQTCFMCELYCEADAIYVGPDRDGRDGVDAAAALASGQLGRLRRDYGWAQDGTQRPLAEFWRLGPLLREGALIAAERYERRRRGD
jgi:NAD-dependent dihydropyrimidine dehydrogenase PreA subunit